MPQPEKSPDEEQFSMFDLMGGMAGCSLIKECAQVWSALAIS